MTPDRTKKVNLITQILLTIIPFGGLYAHYRIQKIQLGIMVNLISIGLFVILIFLLPDYEQSLDDQTDVYIIVMGIGVLVLCGLPYYFLIKWSLDWNRRIELETRQ